jgi:hypothetical protein
MDFDAPSPAGELNGTNGANGANGFHEQPIMEEVGA